MGIDYHVLSKLYLTEQKSAREIAARFKCSENKINYWLRRYSIPKRSISEAIYQRHNPHGNPYVVARLRTIDDFFWLGLGVGLYWGEGTKSNLSSIRLGNTDPDLLRTFISFLERIYKIKKDKLRFGLQIFNDLSPEECLRYWRKILEVRNHQFYKPIISPSQSKGTYRRKALYGVVTLYFNNKKLRDILAAEIEKLRTT